MGDSVSRSHGRKSSAAWTGLVEGPQRDDGRVTGSPLHCCLSRAAKPVPVDAFPEGRSPFDVFNMAGNAWEWVADGTSSRPFVMGDSFQSDSAALDTRARLPVPAEGFRAPADFGFRCVR